MKKKTVFFGVIAVFTVIAILDEPPSFIRPNTAAASSINLNGITALRVTGSASALHLTTASQQPLTANMSTKRSGWRGFWQSAWGNGLYLGKGKMYIDGNTLVIETPDRYNFMWSDCETTVTANLPTSTAVTIDQRASDMDLTGDYSSIHANVQAGRFTLDGHTDQLEINGAALQASAIYRTIRNTESIVITGKMLDASLHFMVPTPISYITEGTAAFVDSALPNTPNAKPSITLKGDMLRATIR